MATLTYRRKTAEGAYTDYTVQYVFKWPVTQQDVVVDPQVKLDSSFTVFYAWADNLSSQVPQQGDQWVDDDSVTWVIKSVQALVRGSQYRCVARRTV